MAGNINTELNTVKVQEQTAASSSAGTQQSASSKPNTVFETTPELNKKKKVLPPEIENLLRSKGYDPTAMTDEEINTTFLLLVAEKTKVPEIVSGVAEHVSQDPIDTATEQSESKEVPASDAKPAQETAVVNPQAAESSTVKTAAEVKSQTPASEEAKPQEQTKTQNYSEKDSVIDFNNEKNRLFVIDPTKTNVYGCDFKTLTDDEKNKYFLTQLTKFQVGDEKWDKMSEEQQAQALQSVNAQLEEKVPSWNKLSANGKAELAKIFTDTSVSFLARAMEDPEARKKSLDVQLEELSQNIIAKEVEEGKQLKFQSDFGAELEIFVNGNSKYSGKTQEELNATGEINNVMYDCIQAKLDKNNNDLSKLNEYERKLYEQFNVAKKLFPDGNLKHLGGYNLDGKFEDLIENDDILASALQNTPKGSDEYKEKFKNYLVGEFKNSNSCQEQFKYYLEHGNPAEKIMMFEIFQKLPEDIQNKIRFSTAEAVQNVGVAVANGNDELTHTAVNGLMEAAGKNGDTDVQDSAMENINELVSDENIATVAITDGLRYGGAEGYKRGAQNGKIKAEQVTGVNTVVLDKENNDKYDASVQNTVVETIGFSTVEGRRGLIDKAAENERTIKTAASKYDTFGKEFEVYSAGKILECAEKNLPEKEAVEVLKTAADTNIRCSAENQAAIHKVFMESKYDEVLEHAASNIYKYDESAQADAIKSTYATNNTKAIDACNGQIEQCSPKAIKAVGADVIEASVKQTAERVISEASYAYADAVIENNKITKNLVEPEELKGLSDGEKRQRLYEDFRKSTPSEQYRLLSKLSKDQLKTVIGMLCKANSSLIKGLVAQGLGSYVLQTIGKSPDVLYTTIDIMMKKGGKDAKCASEYVLSKQSTTHFSDDTILKANEILGKDDLAQLPENETRKYTSNPYGFMKSSLRPGMSAVYPGKKEIFFNA